MPKPSDLVGSLQSVLVGGPYHGHPVSLMTNTWRIRPSNIQCQNRVDIYDLVIGYGGYIYLHKSYETNEIRCDRQIIETGPSRCWHESWAQKAVYSRTERPLWEDGIDI